MFLKNLVAQNPKFARAAIELHQSGALPPDTYVIDLDMLGTNAKTLCTEAHRLGLDVIAMTKQLGRNPMALERLRDNGVDSFVAVDLTDARSILRAKQPLGNVGHLVQIPRHSADEVAAMNPRNWTVFDQTKAAEAARAAHKLGRSQRMLARVYGRHDSVVTSHAGGFDADQVEKVAEDLQMLDGATFAGLTSYPTMVFDKVTHKVHPTPNLKTLEACARQLEAAGWRDVALNAPCEVSTALLAKLADAGATQVEPGHAFTASGGYHAFADLPEKPAMLYLSEVSHLDGDYAFCFGGGLYLCVGSIDYRPQALVGPDFKTATKQSVEATLSQNHQIIDFYGRLTQTPQRTLGQGDSVIFCFRAQAFYVRSHVAPISGIQSGKPRVEGLFTVDGTRV